MVSGEGRIGLEQGRVQAVAGLHAAADQAPTLRG